MSKRNQHQQLQKGTIQTKEKKDGRKGHVAKQKEDKTEFEKRKEKLQKETQDYKYAQSSKFSENARKLALSIIACIWLFIFKEGKIAEIEIFFIISLCFCVIYLAIDLYHYLFDTLSYHYELNKLDQYTNINQLKEDHEYQMNKIASRSFKFIIFKLFILVGASVSFIGGFFVIYIDVNRLCVTVISILSIVLLFVWPKTFRNILKTFF